ncbi:MAG TPA: ABC transporter permease subunit [Lacipirellulaceae bacterium]|nr:ABC transporter permease subunit [Lacipirellulaceae bacterium]
MSVTSSSPDAPAALPAKGLSLGQDAWRRLRKNHVAMTCLFTLITIAVLAFLTPLLPLAPPDQHHTSLQYEPPKLQPLFDRTFSLNWKAIDEASGQLAEVREKLVAAKSQQPTDDSKSEVKRLQNEMQSILYRPYRDAGFPDVGLITRWMIRTRSQVFGDWALGSLAGRDQFGRDVLSRVFWGARISIIVGLVATFVSLVIGVTYGAIAGYVGGWLDEVMMRFVDILYSIPFIFVVIFLITILGEDHTKAWLESWGIDRITIFYFVVGAIYWLTMARVVRGQVISLRTEPFIEAAQSIGARQSRIIWRHILPNLLSVVIVYLTLTIPRVMLFEAFLSFLGLGVEPPDVSWGLLANEGIKVITPIKIYWWLIVFPSLALGITLYALNFLGDGLRDALDPKMAGRGSK